MSALDFELSIAGLPEATIAELDKQLPALMRIVTVLQGLEPTITKLIPDVVAVTPLIVELVAFAKQKEGV